MPVAHDLNIRTRITRIELIIADFLGFSLRKTLRTLRLNFFTVANDFNIRTRITQIERIITDYLCFSLRKTLRTLRLNFFTLANDFNIRTRITLIERIITDYLCFSLRKTLRTLRYNIKNNSLNSQLINKTEKLYTNEIRYHSFRKWSWWLCNCY
jgi:hypothetical protein